MIFTARQHSLYAERAILAMIDSVPPSDRPIVRHSGVVMGHIPVSLT